MGRFQKALNRILKGASDNNISFRDLCGLLKKLKFIERVRGDHHIFSHEQVEEVVNIQPRGSKAKAYQVRQVREILTKYGLAGEDEPEDPPARPDETTDELETDTTEDDDHGN